MDNYYEILNIEQYSDINIVINSYNNIIKNYNNKKKLSLEEKIFIKKLNTAKFVLGNKENKELFDSILKKNEFKKKDKKVDNNKLTERIFEIPFKK